MPVGVLWTVGVLLVLAPLQLPAGNADYDAGRRAAAARRWDEAAKHFESAVRADSTKSAYWMWLGRAYAELARSGGLVEQMRFGPRIKPNLARAVELDPANDDARFFLAEFLLRAPRVAGGSLADATAHADTLARRNSYLGAMSRARFATHRGDSAGARDELRRLAAAHPDSVVPYSLLFDLISDPSGQAEAVALARRLSASACCRRLGLYYVARMALVSGNGLEEGAQAMREYLRGGIPRDGEPALPYAHLRLGQILLRLGKPVEARSEFEAALRADEHFAPARSELARLSRP